ncbi:hypothetical protein AB6A40_009565 [Gnathostoma spinigerum]|uniref:Uncharacterized protein n=1 Tax=Gnathostoma spinigerum TaxID=75299 RepID=A0ABD6EZC5_9BILA
MEVDEKSTVENNCFSFGEFDLKKIDDEIRMEKIRQAASKHSWDYFGQFLRKNLMEKRIVIDADDREDLQRAIEKMRSYMPSEDGRDLSSHIRSFGESLGCDIQCQSGFYKLRGNDLTLEISTDGTTVMSCSVSWFGEPAVDAPYLYSLMTNNQWTKVHNTIMTMLRLIPPLLSR